MDTKIDYLDKCINIICGCTYGCEYCWARNRMAPRLAHNCAKCGQFKPHFHEERLKLIDRIKKPAVVGLNFMGDTWDKNVKPAWREAVIRRINEKTLDQKFIILTKQPQNISDWKSDYTDFIWYPDNLWVGVSIDKMYTMHRWVALSQKEYIRHKIISFEPVLEIFDPYTIGDYFTVYGWPGWIIIGALTKSDKGSMEASRDAARKMLGAIRGINKTIPIFVKDNVQMKNAPKEYPEEMSNCK